MTKLRNRNKTKRRNCVTKRRSHRHRTRSQRGGNLLHTISLGNFGTPDVPVPVAAGLPDTEPKSYWSSAMDWFKGPTEENNTQITGTIKSTVDNLNTEVGNAATRAKNFIAEEASAITEKVKETAGYGDETLNETPSYSSPPGTTGGKSRKHAKKPVGYGKDTLIGTPLPTPSPSPPTPPITDGKSRKHKRKHAKKPVGYGKDTLIGSPLPTPPPSPPTPPITDGKSRKHKHKEGGNNLGLLYYATPVNSVSMKGGKRHKHTCCKGKCKRHKHSASCLHK